MKLIPHERDLVAAFQGQPFDIVGVNCDDDVAKARGAVTRNKMTWRSFRDRVDGRPTITEEWQIRAYPTFYLVDLATSGAHRIRARVTTASGNVADATLALFVDLTAPSVDTGVGPPLGTGPDPVETVAITFTEAIDPASFTREDLRLTRSGGPDLITDAVTITTTEEKPDQWLPTPFIRLTPFIRPSSRLVTFSTFLETESRLSTVALSQPGPPLSVSRTSSRVLSVSRPEPPLSESRPDPPMSVSSPDPPWISPRTLPITRRISFLARP